MVFLTACSPGPPATAPTAPLDAASCPWAEFAPAGVTAWAAEAAAAAPLQDGGQCLDDDHDWALDRVFSIKPGCDGRLGHATGREATLYVVDSGTSTLPSTDTLDCTHWDPKVGGCAEAAKAPSVPHGDRVIHAARWIAPNAPIVSLAVDRGGAVDGRALVCALEHIANHARGPSVVNLSLGAPSEVNKWVEKGIAHLREMGVVVVAAADQGGPKACTDVVSKASTHSVLALRQNNHLGFESLCDNAIAAPGYGILIEKDLWANGTSFAAPLVSGVVAGSWSGKDPPIIHVEGDRVKMGEFWIPVLHGGDGEPELR